MQEIAIPVRIRDFFENLTGFARAVMLDYWQSATSTVAAQQPGVTRLKRCCPFSRSREAATSASKDGVRTKDMVFVLAPLERSTAMTPLDSLYTLVHACFHEAFGPPQDVQGGGEQWTLHPAARYRSQIHLLLNGTPNRPGIWVFDPHDPKNGVENTPIVNRRQIGELITLIQSRLDFANLERDLHHPLPPTPPSSPPAPEA